MIGEEHIMEIAETNVRYRIASNCRGGMHVLVPKFSFDDHNNVIDFWDEDDAPFDEPFDDGSRQ